MKVPGGWGPRGCVLKKSEMGVHVERLGYVKAMIVSLLPEGTSVALPWQAEVGAPPLFVGRRESEQLTS